MPKTIIGIMGPGQGATATDLHNARQLGEAIAQCGWVLLTGGRPAGVMAAAMQGAKAAGGLTVGILPGPDKRAADPQVDIAICTDLGNGRNNVNVLSADEVVACGMGLGTASEVALALKNGKRVILLCDGPQTQDFFRGLAPKQVVGVTTVAAAIAQLKTWC
ncbi:MAG: cytochrome [Cyanobacteria bacterium P01_G01_bin.54]